MKRGWTVLVLALTGAMLLSLWLGCPAGTPEGDSDPYAALRAKVTYNTIFCDEEACCWWDCDYTQIVCGQQNGRYASVGSTLDGFNLDSAPDWWRDERFYLISNYEMNVQSGRGAGLGPAYYYVGTYCGSGEYHTCYTNGLYFDDYAEFQAFLAAGQPYYNCASALGWCAGFCSPNCAGRQCGSDGCGGSCGTCPPGKVCNASGQCVSDGSGDPCSACLSTCRYLPGCCMGCGCLCQDACGMCW